MSPETPRLEAFLDSAPDGIVVADSAGLITLANRRAEELFGYASGELVGREVEQLVPERFRSAHARYRAVYADDPWTRDMGAGPELYGLRKDGSEFRAEISLSPLVEGAETFVISTIRDVTERYAAEARFRALLESAPDAILLVDAEGAIGLANRRTVELFGYDPGELVGRPVEVLVPERLRSRHVAHRAGFMREPRSREMGARPELFGLRKDGTEFPVEISLSPTRIGRNDVVITIVRDVSERRAAEAERLELAREQAAHAEAEAARGRLEAVLGHVDAIVWEADVERRHFHFVSERAADMLGYPLARWLEEGDFWRSLVDPDDLALAELCFREAIARGEDHTLEYRARHAEGGTIWLRDRVRLIRRPDGRTELAGVIVDITGFRDLEERLLHSQKLEAVGQLAAGVAHDFNNLLVVIRGYAELLLTRTHDEASLAQLREITRAAERAGDLTAQLLAFGRRAPSVRETVDVNGLLRGLEPMLRRLIDEDIALTIDASAAVDAVRADPGQLEQVLVNLVINARDAMPFGGEIRIASSMEDVDVHSAAELGLEPGRYVVTAVSDSGSGMTAETKARIFEPFFTTKEQGQGTGLGLATVYGIVEQAGGTIAVDTELGKGSTLFVYLPGMSVGEAEPDVEESSAAVTVLVVEDEDAVRRLVKSVLEDKGYRVHEAANGRQALDVLERRAPRVDLILTDVVMPDVNGPEFVARLDSLGSSAKVLFMSGYADSQLLNRGLSERTVRILRKPFTPTELRAQVAELCGPSNAGSG
jgi:two-component system cell cycle sensor histidine kinase/response regulator CckA